MITERMRLIGKIKLVKTRIARKQKIKKIMEEKVLINSLNKKRIQYIDGLMLGDGCIPKRKWGNTAYYTQAFAYRYLEWAQKIQSDFRGFGIDTKLTLLHKKANKFKNKEYKQWNLHTRGDANHTIFPMLRERWYNGRMIESGNRIIEVKTVPLNIDLSPPQTLGNWYMGDGTYINGKKSNTCHSNLCTRGFTHQEISRLCHKLNKTLLIYTRIDTLNCIRMNVADSRMFLDYIKDYKVNCFAYKWGE